MTPKRPVLNLGYSSDVDRSLALNVQPKYKQLLVALGGPIFLLAFSTVFLGWRNAEYLIDGFYQIVSGALSPFNKPLPYLESLPKFIEESSFLQLVALVSTKIAAFNLLPLSAVNRHRKLTHHWSEPLELDHYQTEI